MYSTPLSLTPLQYCDINCACNATGPIEGHNLLPCTTTAIHSHLQHQLQQLHCQLGAPTISKWSPHGLHVTQANCCECFAGFLMAMYIINYSPEEADKQVICPAPCFITGWLVYKSFSVGYVIFQETPTKQTTSMFGKWHISITLIMLCHKNMIYC